MMKLKKFLAGLTCLALLAAPGAAFADSYNVSLVVNKSLVNSDEAAGQVYINDAGYTMIPLRVVNDAFGYKTDWQKDGSIHITSEDGTVDVSMSIGKKDFTANGTARTFKNLPTLKKDRTYIPAREFSELYGHVYWEKDSRTVWIHQGKNTEYEVIGTKLLRATEAGLQELSLPEGYALVMNTGIDPIVVQQTIGDTTYLGLFVDSSDFMKPVPLFRVNGTGLEYVTDVYGSSTFYVDGDTVYYTDGTGAAGWSNPINPKNLYVADTKSGQVKTHVLDFAVNACTFSMKDGALIATEKNGTQHTIDVKSLASQQA